MTAMTAKSNRQTAFQVIILFGLVSLFGDIVYEGARGVNGPFLEILGANAVIVGIIAGLGEFLGYALRLVSGVWADRTKGYWMLTFVGYGMLVAIPLLSLTNIWPVAFLFIICERLGKALRSPARDAILSQATKEVGTGFGFGIHEAMDQIGAVTGPLIFTGLFFWAGSGAGNIADYQRGYGFLWVPFLLLIGCLVLAFRRVPAPEALETKSAKSKEPDRLTRIFWIYTGFTFITTLGFANFTLLGYHFKARSILSDAQIPLFYALAMAVDGGMALLIGKVYDIVKRRNNSEKGGMVTLIVIPVLSLFLPVLLFSINRAMVLAGVVLWGIVMGAHETIMRSAIADLTPITKRGTGYGIFNTAYGLAMLTGGVLMGFLYERSLPLLIVGAMAVEVLAVPVFFVMKKEALAGPD